MTIGPEKPTMTQRRSISKKIKLATGSAVLVSEAKQCVLICAVYVQKPVV
jgi:hypothetical protein